MYSRKVDNITHTLAGCYFAELFHQYLNSRERGREGARSLVYVPSILAHNFPDIDLAYMNSLPSPLGYLLHHRGHTHTLLGIFPQAFLILVLLYLMWPKFRLQLKQRRFLRYSRYWTLVSYLARFTKLVWGTSFSAIFVSMVLWRSRVHS